MECKKWELYIFFILFLAVSYLYLAPAGPAKAKSIIGNEEENLGITPNTFVNIARESNPAVVYISSTQVIKGPRNFESPLPEPFRDFFGNDFFDKFFNMPQGDLKQKSLGSGFIIDKKGYILTNDHVVRDAKDIRVTLSDENTYDAKIIGQDEDMDVALLTIDVKEDLPVVTLGDSDALRIGEWVVAIGNPFGLEHTVTSGIVSAKWRAISEGPYSSFIQTDASINPGNSGGPLFNIKGEVVGINTAIVAEGQGIGFAIPINMVKDVLDDLKKEGKIKRGWLGLMIQKITPDLAKSFGLEKNNGALVSEVVKGGPAEKSGIKRGDVIIRFNDKQIKEFADLSRYAGLTKPGTKVTLGLIREGKTMELSVKLGEYEKSAQASLSQQGKTSLGMRVQNITPDLAKYFDIDQTEGVLVVEVLSDGAAEEAGIQKGDIIIEVNRKKVRDTKEFDKAVQSSSKSTILLLINRKGQSLYIALGR
ncbi:MAG: DegQ family serine endoprotease [bacterium]